MLKIAYSTAKLYLVYIPRKAFIFLYVRFIVLAFSDMFHISELFQSVEFVHEFKFYSDWYLFLFILCTVVARDFHKFQGFCKNELWPS